MSTNSSYKPWIQRNIGEEDGDSGRKKSHQPKLPAPSLASAEAAFSVQFQADLFQLLPSVYMHLCPLLVQLPSRPKPKIEAHSASPAVSGRRSLTIPPP
jgi:hypothetical protein